MLVMLDEAVQRAVLSSSCTHINPTHPLSFVGSLSTTYLAERSSAEAFSFDSSFFLFPGLQY
jgi:hypothetical protein